MCMTFSPEYFLLFVALHGNCPQNDFLGKSFFLAILKKNASSASVLMSQ